MFRHKDTLCTHHRVFPILLKEAQHFRNNITYGLNDINVQRKNE
jgi:hypothetical protein